MANQYRTITIILIVLLICILALFILSKNSLSLALIFSGYRSDNIRYIEELDISLGKEFTVFQTYSNSGTPVLIRAQKNWLGFWYILDSEEYVEEYGLAYTAWIKGGGIRRFSPAGATVFQMEYHYAYFGDNAISNIYLHPDQLPENCSIHIKQAGKLYWIHIIRYCEDPEQMPVRELLIENGCIAEEQND